MAHSGNPALEIIKKLREELAENTQIHKSAGKKNLYIKRQNNCGSIRTELKTNPTPDDLKQVSYQNSTKLTETIEIKI